MTVSKELLITKVNEVDGYVKATRGHLHENPEVSMKEFETSKFLKEEINKLGLEIKESKGTGFIAILDTGKPGKTIGLRADIDALPMPEDPENLKGPKKWVSKNEGVAHTCGHDGHMAMALGTAKILHDLKDQLTGKIIFIFEHGEEIGGGIQDMMDTIEDIHIDAFWGIHLVPFMPSGAINIEAGPRMAGTTGITIDVIGKGGHGSRPDLSINPVFAAANILTGIGTAWPNRLDVEETVTLGLTTVNGGTAANIIPDKVEITGTLRYFNEEEGQIAKQLIKDVATYTAMAHSCKAEFPTPVFGTQLPVINDAELSEMFTKGLEEVLPEGSIQDVNKWYASESYSRYGLKAPSILAFVGIANPEVGSGAEPHNVKFDIDEDALKVGVLSTVKIVTDFLK